MFVASGRLTADPVLTRVGDDNKTRVLFRFAVNGRDDYPTTFVDVQAWGTLAETIGAHKAKGDAVIVRGRLDFSQWESDDGTKMSKHYVTAAQVEFGAKASSVAVAAATGPESVSG